MKKIYASILTILCISFLAVAQEAAKKPQAPEEGEAKTKPVLSDKIYTEQVLEDFETTQYTDKNLKYRKATHQEGSISIRDQFPANSNNSKKYLGIKVFGRMGDAYTIIPEKDIIIEKRCRSISMWVYGKRFSGQLSIYIKDAKGDNHRLIMGKLDYLGWRKLTVKIPDNIKQEDEYLTQKKVIKLTKIIYRPANSARSLPIWQYLYIDDISALVREKYTDRQSDDW